MEISFSKLQKFIQHFIKIRQRLSTNSRTNSFIHHRFHHQQRRSHNIKFQNKNENEQQ